MLRDVSEYFNRHPRQHERCQLLEDFGAAVASRPLSETALSQSRLALANNELVLESACTAAFFELVTKIVDATNRPPTSAVEAVVARMILMVMGVIYHAYFWLTS